MKLIGFILEHNPISIAKPFLYYTERQRIQPEKLRIIEYLAKGYLIYAWMGYFFDLDTNAPIAPDSYYSDGLWVWPSYLTHYMQKYPNFVLDDEFVAYLRFKNFEFSELPNVDETCKELEIELGHVFQEQQQ